MSQTLISRSRFQEIVETVLKTSAADDTFVSLNDSDDATLRFANNQVVQNVAVHNPSVSVRVAFGKKVGRARTNRFDERSLRWAVRKAEEIARLTPEDPEFLPSLPPQDYREIPSFREPTAEVSPMGLARRTRPVINACEQHNLTAAGIMTNSVDVRGVAASSGLFGHERSTAASYSLTATAEDSSGWTYNTHRDIDRLSVRDRTKSAVDKAVMSAEPVEKPAGHYTVILEPAAVAGIFGPLMWAMNAKSYYKGTSALAGKLGSAILDSRLTVRSDPAHPDLLGSRFQGDGMANRHQTWIDDGVLKQLYYDRFTAKEHGVEPNGFPAPPILTFNGETAGNVEDLIQETERGILITNFWYIRYVNPTDLTLTGMTRDGTFYIENGSIIRGVKNFRFHESPLRAFANVDAATQPMEAITLERGKSLLPAMKLPDFNLSSVTKF